MPQITIINVGSQGSQNIGGNQIVFTGHSPYISESRTWMIWDDESGEYTDTAIHAESKNIVLSASGTEILWRYAGDGSPATLLCDLDDIGIQKGDDGLGVSSGEVNAEGKLILTMTDGSTIDVGKVKYTAITDITGLETALSGKAASTHTHAQSDITGLETALEGKAATTHTHAPVQTGIHVVDSLPETYVAGDIYLVPVAGA